MELKKKEEFQQVGNKIYFLKGFFNDVINFFYGIIFYEFEKYQIILFLRCLEYFCYGFVVNVILSLGCNFDFLLVLFC